MRRKEKRSSNSKIRKGRVQHNRYETSSLEPRLLSPPQETGMVVQTSPSLTKSTDHSKGQRAWRRWRLDFELWQYCLRRNRSLRFPTIDLRKPAVKLFQQYHEYFRPDIYFFNDGDPFTCLQRCIVCHTLQRLFSTCLIMFLT